jgi:nicotinamide-nucleotide amidase
MIAEVISIGDELTSGERLDTNSQWLSQRLGEAGLRTRFHTTVADDLEANIEAFRTAWGRADVVISTGGLGPTADDLTRAAIAAALDTNLVLDADSLRHIETLFRNRRREMPPQNRVQAMFPRGSRPIPNPHGTAPGITVTVRRGAGGSAAVFALPGVPAEMREMWQQTVLPAIADRLGDQRFVVCHHTIKCFGVGESDLESMLPGLIQRGRYPTVGLTASRATLTLRITTREQSVEACRRAMQPTIDMIHNCLGNLVFGDGLDELQDVVICLLRERARTLATLECGTGGLLAQWLGEANAAERAYLGGTVVSRNAMRSGPTAPFPMPRTASWISSGVARNMACAIRERFGTDYGLAVTDFPETDSLEGGPAAFFVGLATPAGVLVKRHGYGGHPDLRKHRSAKQALNFLRLHLLDRGSDPAT